MSVGMYETYYDINKLSIKGKPNEDGTIPRFNLSFRDGNPRFVVYSGVEKGIINFGSDYHMFNAILEGIETITRSRKGSKISFDSIGTKWVNNEDTREKELKATLHVGKSNEGIIYISLIAPLKPKVVFTFINSDWHKFHESAREPMKDEKISRLMARGYVSMVKNVVSIAIMDYTREAFNKGEFKPGVIDKNFTPGNKGGFNKTQVQQKPVEKVTEKNFTLDEFTEDVPLI